MERQRESKSTPTSLLREFIRQKRSLACSLDEGFVVGTTFTQLWNTKGVCTQKQHILCKVLFEQHDGAYPIPLSPFEQTNQAKRK